MFFCYKRKNFVFFYRKIFFLLLHEENVALLEKDMSEVDMFKKVCDTSYSFAKLCALRVVEGQQILAWVLAAGHCYKNRTIIMLIWH